MSTPGQRTVSIATSSILSSALMLYIKIKRERALFLLTLSHSYVCTCVSLYIRVQKEGFGLGSTICLIEIYRIMIGTGFYCYVRSSRGTVLLN